MAADGNGRGPTVSDAEALEFHARGRPGKLEITPTKPMATQKDLSLAYSPGVAYACLAIEEDPKLAHDYTSRGNLVGVVTNGTAVLGLGDIGPLAAKPVMEGKGCLFKKFAGIDVFDIELAERDPDKLIEIIAALEPTLGGVNLEDIKAPECFYIEKKLRERMNIPVFHDDQHGTAIISSAALLNGLELVGKDIGAVKIAVSGAGAAAIACLDVMVGLGVKRENVFVCDSKGLIQSERADACHCPGIGLGSSEDAPNSGDHHTKREGENGQPFDQRGPRPPDKRQAGDAKADRIICSIPQKVERVSLERAGPRCGTRDDFDQKHYAVGDERDPQYPPPRRITARGVVTAGADTATVRHGRKLLGSFESAPYMHPVATTGSSDENR